MGMHQGDYLIIPGGWRTLSLRIFYTDVRTWADDTTPDLGRGFDRLRVSRLRADSNSEGRKRVPVRARRMGAGSQACAPGGQHAVPLRKRHRSGSRVASE